MCVPMCNFVSYFVCVFCVLMWYFAAFWRNNKRLTQYWRYVLWPFVPLPFVSVAFCLVAFCLWPFVRWPFVCTPLYLAPRTRWPRRNFVKILDAGKTRMIVLPYGEKLWRYVKPFSSDTGTLRTDRQTDRQTSISLCWRAIKTQHFY